MPFAKSHELVRDESSHRYDTKLVPPVAACPECGQVHTRLMLANRKPAAQA